MSWTDMVWEAIDTLTYWLTIAAAGAFIAGVLLVWRMAGDVRAIRAAVESARPVSAATPAAAGVEGGPAR